VRVLQKDDLVMLRIFGIDKKPRTSTHVTSYEVQLGHMSVIVSIGPGPNDFYGAVYVNEDAFKDTFCAERQLCSIDETRNWVELTAREMLARSVEAAGGKVMW
jgi:hypothetical protein